MAQNERYIMNHTHTFIQHNNTRVYAYYMGNQYALDENLSNIYIDWNNYHVIDSRNVTYKPERLNRLICHVRFVYMKMYQSFNFKPKMINELVSHIR